MATKRGSAARPPAAEPAFIFRGVIAELGQNNLEGIPADPLDATVRVEEVAIAPAMLGPLAGRMITVRLAKPAKAGLKAVFVADGWVYGAELGVIERERLATDRFAATLEKAQLSRLASLDDAVRARLAASDLVITGVVLAVDDAGVYEGGEGTHWALARVEVRSVLSGTADETVGVLFPTIAGPRFRQAPRFVVGQDGLWVLQRAEREKRTPPRERKGAFTALDPVDFQGVSAADRIETLLATTPKR